MSEQPLVSCIMPTRDRRAFAARAIASFLRQDYRHRELVVVDQGRDPVADLVPDGAPVRYLAVEAGQPLGRLRNLACAAAAGAVILHWDDDDWMAPWRISYQVDGLLRGDADLSGISRAYYLDVRDGSAWEYIYPEGRRPYVVDSTLCYWRSLWERQPFVPEEQDTEVAFQWNGEPKRYAVLPDHSFYVATIHHANGSAKNTRAPRWHRRDPALLRELMGEGWDSYNEAQSVEAQSAKR